MLDQFSAVLYILTAIAYFINEWRKDRRDRRKTNPSTFEAAYKLESQIYPILWNLLISFKALRIYIIQFHNGEHFYSGQSIQRYSISQEVSRPGTFPIRRSYINIPVTYRMHELIKYLKLNSKKITQDINSLEEDAMEWDFMRLHDIQSMYEYHIMDFNNNTIGVLNIHFDVPNVLTDVDHLKVNNAINQIRNLLIRK